MPLDLLTSEAETPKENTHHSGQVLRLLVLYKQIPPIHRPSLRATPLIRQALTHSSCISVLRQGLHGDRDAPLVCGNCHVTPSTSKNRPICTDGGNQACHNTVFKQQEPSKPSHQPKARFSNGWITFFRTESSDKLLSNKQHQANIWQACGKYVCGQPQLQH